MLLVKALAIPALFTASVAAAPVQNTYLVFTHISAIHQVSCIEGSGTAFEAGGHMISVNHVTTLTDCAIEGKHGQATSEPGDFSTIALPAKGFKIDCTGFHEGEVVYAIGYADGLPVQRVLTLVATGEYASNGEALLLGDPTVIPGMSGGPIINSQGQVVGTVNMFADFEPISLSRELRGTSVCK